jgi:hypothetical protein
MTDEQRIAVLSLYPNHEAAEILGVSRERARQLRISLGVMTSTQDLERIRRENVAKQYYIDYMTQELIDPNRSRNKSWGLAGEFAAKNDLPWPPPNPLGMSTEDTKAYEVWKYAKDNPEATWEQIGEKLGSANACSVAGRFARTHNYEWPLRGGTEGWRNND